MSKKVIIIGASGHGRVIADIIEQNGDQVLGFLDDDLSKKKILGYDILGNTRDIKQYKKAYYIIGIGNNAIRREIAERYQNMRFYTAVHPHAVISKHVIIQPGTCIMAGAIINTTAEIGRHCIINTGAIIEHDCILEDYVHISPNATVCGTVHIGNNTHIGAAAVVRNNICISHDVVVGAGSTVVKNIKNSGIYIGIPAKEIVK